MGIDFPLATETRSTVIDDLLLKLRENYVFPDVAKEMDSSISEITYLAFPTLFNRTYN